MRDHLIVQASGTQDFSQQVTRLSVSNKTSNLFSSDWSQHFKINFLLPPNSAEMHCLGYFLPRRAPAKGFPITCEGWHPCWHPLSPSFSQTHHSPAGRVADLCPHKALGMSNFSGVLPKRDHTDIQAFLWKQRPPFIHFSLPQITIPRSRSVSLKPSAAISVLETDCPNVRPPFLRPIYHS